MTFPNEVLEFPAAVTLDEVRQAINERLAMYPYGHDLRIAAGFTLLDFPDGPWLVQAGQELFGIRTI